jgi:hypothetical protein
VQYLATVLRPVYSVLPTVKDLKTADKAAAVINQRWRSEVHTRRELWEEIPRNQRKDVFNDYVLREQDSLDKWHKYFRENIQGLRKNQGILLALDDIGDVLDTLRDFEAMKDGRPFTFAGLWEGWKDPESGEWLRTCTIITGDSAFAWRANSRPNSN